MQSDGVTFVVPAHHRSAWALPARLHRPMTEAEARELLRRCDGIGGLEAWIARQAWQPAPGGWAVRPELYRIRLEAVAEGVRVTAAMPGTTDPAVWVVRDR